MVSGQRSAIAPPEGQRLELAEDMLLLFLLFLSGVWGFKFILRSCWVTAGRQKVKTPNKRFVLKVLLLHSFLYQSAIQSGRSCNNSNNT